MKSKIITITKSPIDDFVKIKFSSLKIKNKIIKKIIDKNECIYDFEMSSILEDVNNNYNYIYISLIMIENKYFIMSKLWEKRGV